MSKFKPKRYYPPLAEDFIFVRRSTCLSKQQVANFLHVTLKTVTNWESGRTTIPYAAFKLLRIMSRYELPGDKWEGWSINGGALFTPTGRSFQSHELFYIANMFQMARYWISDREQARNLAIQTKVLERPSLRLLKVGLS